MAKVSRSVRIEAALWADAQRVAELYDMNVSGLIGACLLQVTREHAAQGPVDIIRESPLSK